ncbi:MAG: alpha/beta fold hydrolase, partial [Ktedonobacterales bacterium]|nr:alpha/beta fold hydrolase [Ktedonobacterales bacterium]
MRPIRWLRRGMALVGLGAAGAAVVVTARHLLETPQPLESALPGEGQIDRRHGGNLYYNVAGDSNAPPLVLLHGLYSGASNYEFRRVFPRFAVNFRVYAPDWLGFGMSEHPHIAYTGEFYASTLMGLLRDVVRQPASVIATGRAANIAVRAAADAPDLFERLVLVSPNAQAGTELEPTFTQTLARTAQRTSLSLVPYAVLATRPALRRSQSARGAHYDDPTTREAAIEHLYASAHQFGGEHALMALFTGELDLPIQNALALLEPPALIVSGGDDPGHPREEMEDLAILSPHTDLEVIPGAGESVMEDQPAAFAEVVTRWLESGRGRHTLSDEALLPPIKSAAPSVAERTTSALRESPIKVIPTSQSEILEDAPASPPAISQTEEAGGRAVPTDPASGAPPRPAAEARQAPSAATTTVPIRTPEDAVPGQVSPMSSEGREDHTPSPTAETRSAETRSAAPPSPARGGETPPP